MLRARGITSQGGIVHYKSPEFIYFLKSMCLCHPVVILMVFMMSIYHAGSTLTEMSYDYIALTHKDEGDHNFQHVIKF